MTKEFGTVRATSLVSLVENLLRNRNFQYMAPVEPIVQLLS